MYILDHLPLILTLAFLEGILSVDNAIVLALQVRVLPPGLQKKALTYGIVGAILFRLFALSILGLLMKWTWIKWVGGGYLIWVSGRHLLKPKSNHESAEPSVVASFWKTVLLVELTDIAFAVDSILAAVALSNEFWVVFLGGVMGMILMRFASGVFVNLLKQFPQFEFAAYRMVFLIGLKLCVDGMKLPHCDFNSLENPAFWIFWGLLALCFLSGFRKKV